MTEPTQPEPTQPQPTEPEPVRVGATPAASTQTSAAPTQTSAATGPPTQPMSPQPPPGWTGAPPPRRSLWAEATSTRGGRVATGIALAVTALLLIGLLLAGLFVAARVWGTVLGHHGPAGMSQVRGGGPGMPGGVLPPGQQKRQQAPGQGQGRGGSQGNGQGKAQRNGLGDLMRGATALGTVQHGEFTVRGADGKDVVVTLQRGSVTSASATSLAVRSADGFTATYAVNADTRVQGAAGSTPASGARVLVLARKDSKAALLVRAQG